MESSTFTTLTRQIGLEREMATVANNIANMSTTGYRAEGLLFTEYVKSLGPNEPSLSMATASAHFTDQTQAALTRTGGRFDLAIEGPGYFQIQTPAGPRLTRAGAFTPDAQGVLVTPEGYQLLDAGGTPVFVPPDARSVSIAADATVSADGQPLSRIGLVKPADPARLSREDGVRFRAAGGIDPIEGSRIVQGYLESSNVNPVEQIARMIEVQRAYEQGQSFLDREDKRIRSVLRLMAG